MITITEEALVEKYNKAQIELARLWKIRHKFRANMENSKKDYLLDKAELENIDNNIKQIEGQYLALEELLIPA